MYRYHVEVFFIDGAVYVFSVEKLKEIEEILNEGVHSHGVVRSIIADREFYN